MSTKHERLRPRPRHFRASVESVQVPSTDSTHALTAVESRAATKQNHEVAGRWNVKNWRVTRIQRVIRHLQPPALLKNLAASHVEVSRPVLTVASLPAAILLSYVPGVLALLQALSRLLMQRYHQPVGHLISEMHRAEESSQEQPRESGQGIKLEAVDSLICPVVKRQISLDTTREVAC